MEKMFNDVLDDDEKIVKVMKPNKRKFYSSMALKVSGILIFILIWVTMPFLGITFEENNPFVWYYYPIPIGIAVLIALLFILLSIIYYKNLFFAYTNKRVIIRSGIFGVDYKSLDMGMIGAVNVYVSLLDKIVGKNTGTISFGSMASPILTNQNGMANHYRFSHIEKPYEFCKEIKSTIDKFKKSSKE